MHLVALNKKPFEFFSIFQTFYNEIKTQFGISIWTLRTDNGHEYLSHSFQQFMHFHSILYQTSCVYTSQQNGVIEHKNNILFKQLNILLIHGEAILTACYFINHMPSLVLDNKIPHFTLFPHESLYPLPLKVFGFT